MTFSNALLEKLKDQGRYGILYKKTLPDGSEITQVWNYLE